MQAVRALPRHVSVKSQALTLAPLDALISNRKLGFLGNVAAPDGKFITDGRTLFLRSACDQQFLAKLKPYKTLNYGPESPLPEERAAALFKHAVSEAKHEAEIGGYVLGRQVIGCRDEEQAFACVASGSSIVLVDGHRLSYAQHVTGTDDVRVGDEKRPIVLLKSGQPVAIIISIHDPAVSTAIQKVLDGAIRLDASVEARRRIAS